MIRINKFVVFPIILIIVGNFIGCGIIEIKDTNTNPTNKPIESQETNTVAKSPKKKEKTAQNKTTEVPKFHLNEKINGVIQDFNSLSDVKIKEEDASQDYSYQTFFTIDDVWVRISYNSNMKTIFVDYSQESQSIAKIKKYCKLFMKALDKKVSDYQIAETFKELETYKYQNYNAFKQGNFELTLSKDDLAGTKDKRFTLKTAYHE